MCAISMKTQTLWYSWYTRAWPHTHTHEFTCVHTKHVHEHVCTHIYSCIHKCTCAHTHSNTQPFVQMDMNTKVRQGRRKRERYIGKNLSRKQCLQYKYPERGGSKVDVLCPVPLIYMSVSVPVTYCFDVCGLIPLLGIYPEKTPI